MLKWLRPSLGFSKSFAPRRKTRPRPEAGEEHEIRRLLVDDVHHPDVARVFDPREVEVFAVGRQAIQRHGPALSRKVGQLPHLSALGGDDPDGLSYPA